MGATEDTGQGLCQSCHTGGPTVRERGRVRLMAVLCDSCWNAYANQLAIEEGATAPPQVEPDPDDVTPYEPVTCGDCGAAVRHYPTNYDRWVYLAVDDLPAKDVAPRYRWRLQTIVGRHSRVPVDIVAVRIRGIEPLPSDAVRPAHRAVCLNPEAVQEAERERAADAE
ncbi:DUF6083 domain-containing protein [Streptomyces auratus]|uniref:Uncharacterized protein n=1 Tax=Streptomyces auratus AGR0001 TaxID=1160718 RepID=J2JWC6_9ACTN|nr:DUF6083 domain-containing protein [Streptomyces auratus]QTZ91581.1 hypothetical protein SU9_008865 [Streptomyces auratus AGR0001]